MTEAPPPTATAETCADALLAALRQYTATGSPVDLVGPADALVAAVRGTATDEAIAVVIDSVTAVVSRFWQALTTGRADRQYAEAITATNLQQLKNALFGLLNPFDQQEDLLAAERAVAELEAASGNARSRLEAAVDAQDLQAVMELRIDAEVTLPGQLAQARTRLMELQLAAAEHQLTSSGAVKARADRKAEAAVKTRDAAAEALRLAVAELATAEAERENARNTQASVRAEVDRRRAALKVHAEDHDREQRDRIRKLAGLAA
uniref:hypothetical protein n=1 Tax=Paractinoplanes polyasparticus TaxID=2856853 RepID=UPI001C861B80|nr:hypothetical protein [Actinoplanes polyasparticus]